MSGAAEPVLTIENLRVRIRGSGAVVVNDVSLQLMRGEILGLVGESGSGKTTTALAALGYARRGLRIVSGRVAVSGGIDLLAASPRRLRDIRGRTISYVPQDPYSALNPTMHIAGQLQEAIRRSSQKLAAAQIESRGRELMDAVGLPGDAGFLRRFPHQLSGGQRQRLTIAMAFACTPRAIVLDEPTTGLDVTTQSLVLSTVSRLSSEHGVAGLYVSHDLAVVHEVSTQVAVMYAGAVVEHGPVGEVLGAPWHPYTQALLDAVPSLQEQRALQGIPGQAPAPATVAAPGCSFADRCAWSAPACRASTPVLRALTPGSRVVACHRAEEIRAGREPVEILAARPETGGPASVASGEAPVLSADLEDASYGPVTVLRQLQLSLAEGECLGIVGESGSGKTTLARCIAGLHSDYRGTISYAGTQLAAAASGRRPHERLAIQYIFQNPYNSLNPRKTIRQILQQPFRLLPTAQRGESMERLASALAEVSLPADLLSRYPDELSGGQRQRVALARALMADPRVLICDEVTSALDVSVQAVVIELLRSLRASRRLSVLFITHDLALARAICDQIAVVHDGRVVESGTSADIISHPRADYTRQLISNVPVIPEVSHPPH
jgi:peptide/nickel transport system ATP-binding protein